jgi:hypothetical protein
VINNFKIQIKRWVSENVVAIANKLKHQDSLPSTAQSKDQSAAVRQANNNNQNTDNQLTLEYKIIKTNHKA